MVTSRAHKNYYDANVPFMKNISPEVFALGIIPVTLFIGFIALYAYCWLFSFYDLLLSAFAEMQPATLIANADDYFQKNPWQRILLPFKSNEILRIHIMTIAMTFLMMITWALLRESYQQLTIILLIGIFYLIPKKRRAVAILEGII